MSNKRKSDLLNNDEDSNSFNSTVKNDAIDLDDSLIFNYTSDKNFFFTKSLINCK
jgi:hypothetical protein